MELFTPNASLMRQLATSFYKIKFKPKPKFLAALAIGGCCALIVSVPVAQALTAAAVTAAGPAAATAPPVNTPPPAPSTAPNANKNAELTSTQSNQFRPLPNEDVLPDWYLAIKPEHSTLGVIAWDLTHNRLLVSDNARRAMLPASVQKLLLATAASHQLGNEFQFKTRLYAKGMSPGRQSPAPDDKANNKGKVDSLYLEFSGDPSLTQAQLNALLAPLKGLGISSIGSLTLVGAKEASTKARGWVWDDLGVCYAAPVSEFVIDENCIRAYLVPAKDGKSSQVRLPKSGAVTIDNALTLDIGASPDSCRPELEVTGDNHYRLYGCWHSPNSLPLSIAVSEPNAWARSKVTAAIGKLGISIGSVSFANEVASGAHLLSEHSSLPLPELVTKMLKESDNLIADAFFKTLGKLENSSADFIGSSQAMETSLSELGLELDHSRLLDGSGLSRYNLLSAQTLFNTLELIHDRPELNSLIEALPIAAKDGTLAYRRGFGAPPLKDKVFAKTGSMQGVANLAGFATSKDSEIAFVVIENGLVEKAEGKTREPGFSALFLKALLSR
ncbi:D-alanyl-D-alanine carboxypeptidase/D-alanyl-D-alanine-endopeptidase [Shewanella khirikhana]|uniref:D-alanyl-D-alanine carboxypeptidase DacB n=1 Tax=Shewanella khirikhana TaxID=1965282 RepID=A0ABM7DAZ1_9GAMM|nr:D-alanyl-D-alanine carboxypeptidase/D-alanyl-D-alanine-endopeptidase [Shewanella khirikhana]AZQ10542.1 D-alanyl-D-alanine carboxypeptidase DacB precursor [Shewanella khirikhana]